MPTNVYFSPKNKQEQFLYEDLVIESLKMYGQDIKYIPRESITVDELLNDFAWNLDIEDDQHASATYKRDLIRKVGKNTILSSVKNI